jgi:hypothetical protein
MRTSLIVNTACGDPHARSHRNIHRSTSYGDRWEGLKQIVSQCEFDEIIVCGIIPEDDGLAVDSYIHLVGGYGDRRDALLQREVGARGSTGDLLIFTHDDHMPGFSGEDIHDVEDWDILVPQRVHGVTGEILNNGKEQGYMGGHTLVMHRNVWVRLPWVSVVPDRCWDLPMTQLWYDNDIRIAFSDILQSIDIEAQPNEV